MPVPRIVFDTNIVVSALVFGARLGWMRRLWSAGVVKPVVCRETTTELLRVLAYPKFRLTPDARNELLADYLPVADVIHLTDPLPVLQVDCRDRHDAVFIHLAIAAKADFLVSGDVHLTSLRGQTQVTIMQATEFRQLMQAG